MKNRNYLPALLSLLLILASSCDKEEDFTKAILGKWEITQFGNGIDLMSVTPDVQFEYLPNGIVLVNDYSHDTIVQREYRMTNSILIRDGVRFRYEFITPDKIRLDYVDLLAIFNTFIYERKEIDK